MIRVNDPHENATWVYNYDRGGNILSKVKYAYTTGTVGTALETIPYTYGDSNWKDKLTAYNGAAITYDVIGNPLNDGSWTYEWAVGRQLKKMSRDGQSLTFKYDHNGMRIQKVLEHSWYPETTNYTYHGKLLTHMEVNYTDFDEVGHTDKLHFFYDAQSRPAKVRFNGTIYTYLQNLQGDIVGILDSNGALMVEYKYDAWGKPLSVTGSLADTLGIHNPFRYRGYVYDEESELYYLRSRYYNPAVSRFTNADNYMVSRGSLYAYCDNRPIAAVDRSGHKCTYDAIDNYAKPSEASDPISDFFARISKIIGRQKDYSNLGSGTVTYKSETKTVANSSAQKVVNQLLQIGITGILGYLSTALISSPLVGGVAAIAQYSATEVAKWQVALSIPNIPEGVYTHETVEYREEVPGFLGYTYVQTCHYLHGYDVSGCTYFAVWEESYSYSAAGVDHMSNVLAQRTQ